VLITLPDVLALAVPLVVLPVAAVPVAVDPLELAIPFLLVFEKVSDVDVLVCEWGIE